jgi:beta-lactamase class A
MENAKQTSKNQSGVFRKRTVAIAFFAMGIFATLLIFTIRGKITIGANGALPHENGPSDVNIYNIQRLKGFQNIQPVVTVGPQEESVRMQPMKNELITLIDSLKTVGMADNVSVYLKNFKRGGWISVNEKEAFHPASLMKVPLMLAVLKTAENSPGLLEKKIVYHKMPGKTMFQQHFQGPSITEGQTYSVHDLIYYCAANSDNNATHALETNIDLSKVINLFNDIGLPKPELQNADFTINARDYSSFMETIFNSAFLGPEYSEYAAEMLVNCHFKEGFSKGLPAGTKVWHKFGEWTRAGVPDVELHESGTIFIDGKPYLLTVMTRGKDLGKLALSLQKIAALVSNRLYKLPVSIARAAWYANGMNC